MIRRNEIEEQAEKIIEEKEKLEYDVGLYLSVLFFFYTIELIILIDYYIENKYWYSFCLSSIFLIFVPFIQKIKKKKVLKNDKEYQLAKKVVKNYKKKKYEFYKEKEKLKEKIKIMRTLQEEVSRTNRIVKMEEYLKENKKRSFKK